MTTLTFDPELLKRDFESTAEYRRWTASRFPGDSRNAEAIKILDTLAATVDAVDPAVLNAYGELFEDVMDGEVHGEMLRRIGFESWPSTATEFVREFIASRTAA